jgi:polysaccharide export outer membrane protein
LPSLNSTSEAQFNLYRLDTGDSVNVNVPRFAEFSGGATIDSEGNVILPIIGRISLTGLTLAEAEQKISYELSTRFLQQRPEVLITLTEPRPAQITLLGEVVKPGFYAFVSGSPLTVALQAAGGSTQRADLRSVILRRSLADGSVIEEEVDLYTPLISGKALPDIRLQGGDTIVVPKLEVGKDRDYDQRLVARTTLPQQTIAVRIVAPVPEGGTALRNVNLPNGSTFLDAIASLPAGDGLLVRVEEIALMRFDPERGTVITQKLNTKKALNGDIAQNIPLQDEDVIIVSRTLIGKAFNFFNVLTRPIRDILGFRAFFDFIFDD